MKIINSISACRSARVGYAGETLAISFLRSKGFRLIKRNYRIRGGELDLIMENDYTLLFVEVKTRTNSNFGEPEDSLTSLQIRKIVRAILHYLGEFPHNKKWRCDLVAIKYTGCKDAQVKHIKDILNQ